MKMWGAERITEPWPVATWGRAQLPAWSFQGFYQHFSCWSSPAPHRQVLFWKSFVKLRWAALHSLFPFLPLTSYATKIALQHDTHVNAAIVPAWERQACREVMPSFSDSFSIHPSIPTYPGPGSTFAAISPDILLQAGCAVPSAVLPRSLIPIFKLTSLLFFTMLGYLVTSQEEHGVFIIYFLPLGP